jgi:hypothetical protein
MSPRWLGFILNRIITNALTTFIEEYKNLNYNFPRQSDVTHPQTKRSKLYVIQKYTSRQIIPFESTHRELCMIF